jgi:hypothetical protein
MILIFTASVWLMGRQTGVRAPDREMGNLRNG